MDFELIRIMAAKLGAHAVLPLSIAIGFLLLAIFALSRPSVMSARRAIWIALASLAICSAPPTGHALMGALERRHLPLTNDQVPERQVAVVLGGGIRDFSKPRTMIELAPAGNRVLYAARLYRAGKISRILVTGGSLMEHDQLREAELMKRLLVEWGVPVEHIIVEDRSRTTWENAQNVAALWSTMGLKSGLLVTSAFHMPRALAAFQKVGIDVVPASTDIYSSSGMSLLDVLPAVEGLALFTMALREWIGVVGYRLAGRG